MSDYASVDAELDNGCGLVSKVTVEKIRSGALSIESTER